MSYHAAFRLRLVAHPLLGPNRRICALFPRTLGSEPFREATVTLSIRVQMEQEAGSDKELTASQEDYCCQSQRLSANLEDFEVRFIEEI